MAGFIPHDGETGATTSLFIDPGRLTTRLTTEAQGTQRKTIFTRSVLEPIEELVRGDELTV